MACSLLVFAFSACSQQADKQPEKNMITTLESVSKKAPEWSKDAAIYEVNLRQYSQEGTFAAFEPHLPRLQKMGIKIIWLMPIHPIGVEKRKGALGSYYSVKDYTGIDPSLGTLDDFKRLVRKTHELGMYLVLDWVANHSAWDNPWMEKHPDWYTRNDSGEVIPPVPDWSDVADLNFDNHDMRAEMIRALAYWVEETDIDGFRCDMAGMVPLDFWRAARKQLDDIKPVFMLGEWEEPSIHEAFDMSYTWKLHHLMKDVAHQKNTAKDIRATIETYLKEYPPDAYRVQFTSNHDENSWQGTVFERLGDGAEAFAALTTVIPGMPLIYSGQEAGLSKRLAFFEKDVIDWQPHPFAELYTTLLHLKRDNEALWNGEYGGGITFIDSDSEHVLAFTREKDGNSIAAVFNLSATPQRVEMTAGDLEPVFPSGPQLKSQNGQSIIELKPWAYQIYKKADK